MGLDADRLEAVRVSASKTSPLADTLDLCARFTHADALPAVVPCLSQLITRGVGLNTRTGTARFIGQLTSRLHSDMRPHAGTLIKVRPQGASPAGLHEAAESPSGKMMTFAGCSCAWHSVSSQLISSFFPRKIVLFWWSRAFAAQAC